MADKNAYRHELRQLLVTCRKRLSVDSFPELRQRAGARRRTQTGLTQEEVALVAGYSTRWYSNLERGVVDDPSPSLEFLGTIATTLMMSHDERRLLFLYSLGHEPPTQAGTVRENTVAVPGWKAIVEGLGVSEIPAYLSNGNWDIDFYNRPFAELFPQGFGPDGCVVPGHGNVMRDALLNSEMREVLVDWEKDWATPLVSQLRSTLTKAGNPREWDETLRDLVRDVSRDRATARIWFERLTPRLSSDGDVRRVIHPKHGMMTYQINTAEPHSMPQYRLVTFVPLTPGVRAS